MVGFFPPLFSSCVFTSSCSPCTSVCKVQHLHLSWAWLPQSCFSSIFFFFKEAWALSIQHPAQTTGSEAQGCFNSIYSFPSLVQEANSSEMGLGVAGGDNPKPTLGMWSDAWQAWSSRLGEPGRRCLFWELMSRPLTPPIRLSPIGSEGERCSGWINIGAV